MKVFVEDRLKQLWKDLSDLEMTEESHGLREEEKLELERICSELEKATLLEEICWRQKSGVLCIGGDRHHITNSHKRFNSIDRLMMDGELSLDPEVIAKCISHFYRLINLF